MTLDSIEPRQISDATILEIYGSGGLITASRKAQVLLRVSAETGHLDLVNGMPVGAWNIALLKLRKRHFGPTIHLIDQCPQCSETVEFLAHIDELLANTSHPDPNQTYTISLDKWEVIYRPLSGGDMVKSSQATSTDSIERGKQLLGQAIVSAKQNGKATSQKRIPSKVWEMLAQAQSENDPASEILFDLCCPQCQKHWDSLLEPGEYLWLEISSYAKKLLYQVHILASNYGWTEKEILSLSDERRATYLNLIEESKSQASQLM